MRDRLCLSLHGSNDLEAVRNKIRSNESNLRLSLHGSNDLEAARPYLVPEIGIRSQPPRKQ